MITIFCDKIPRIIKAKWELEKVLDVKIFVKGRDVTIDGTPENEFLAQKVIEAIDMGFPFKNAIMIKEDDFMFEKVNIKEYTKKTDLERIRARIIGKEGKVLRTLVSLTNCFFEIKDNVVGIVGPPEWIKNAQEAIILLVKGTKHGNVYAFLEHHQVEEIEDYGIKEVKKKKRTKTFK